MPNFYYPDQNNQKQGPVTEQQLKELAVRGVITPNTPLITDGGHKGLAGQIPGLQFGKPAPQRVTQPASKHHYMDTNSDQRVKTLNLYFTVFWVSCVALIPTCGFAGIVTMIFWFMLVYQMWKLIPVDIARTTPGKAVGFYFIPLFNLYWQFVAIKGLGEDMNETLRQRGIQYEVNVGLGQTFCLLALCQAFFASLPLILTIGYQEHVAPTLAIFGNIINLAINLAAIVALIFFVKSAKNGAIALLEQREY